MFRLQRHSISLWFRFVSVCLATCISFSLPQKLGDFYSDFECRSFGLNFGLKMCECVSLFFHHVIRRLKVTSAAY